MKLTVQGTVAILVIASVVGCRSAQPNEAKPLRPRPVFASFGGPCLGFGEVLGYYGESHGRRKMEPEEGQPMGTVTRRIHWRGSSYYCYTTPQSIAAATRALEKSMKR